MDNYFIDSYYHNFITAGSLCYSKMHFTFQVIAINLLVMISNSNKNILKEYNRNTIIQFFTIHVNPSFLNFSVFPCWDRGPCSLISLSRRAKELTSSGLLSTASAPADRKSFCSARRSSTTPTIRFLNPCSRSFRAASTPS